MNWPQDAFYILQPGIDQSICLARLIKKSGSTHKVVAITLPDEGLHCASEYDFVNKIRNYNDIPEGLFIIPTGAASTEALLAAGDVTLGDVTLKRNALIAYDKKAFLSLCERSSLPTPRTYYSLEEIPASEFPIFFKQALEKGGGTRGVAYTPCDVPAHIDGTLIFQRFIDSQGTYGVGFIAQDGVILAAQTHFERESFPATGGSAVIIESLDSPELFELTKRVVIALNYSGWGLAEFKLDPKTKSFVFMEVNAKFWASCDLAFRSNPYFAKHLLGIEIKTEKIDRQFYLNRGLLRGPIFIISNIKKLLRSDLVNYPGLTHAFTYGLIPKVLIALLRTARLRMRGG